MALGLATRELELIIIAHDRASSTLARVGGGLAILGAGMTRVGVAGIRAFSEMAGEAIEFEKQVALAYTQVFDKSKITMDQVEDVIVNVARNSAAPIDELQAALFDVFSSLDVAADDAEHILQRVADASVAGQTDVRSALVPTIAVLNAYQKDLSEVDNVLDVQFKTVQKGILTYDELVQNIGKAIPAAVASGQEFETLGAMMAFMTRNGLNTAMAATSAARGLELLTRPKVTKELEAQGIAVRNNEGEFRQINEIINDLGMAWGHLTAPERKAKFEEVFGTGTIQARRFFDLAIPNFNDLNALVEEFGDSSGAMQDAYDTMSDTTAVQLEALTNRWIILRKEIGDNLIPEITSRLVPALDQVLDRWEGLTDEQKASVAEFGAIGSLALTAAGGLTTFAGIATLVIAVWKIFITNLAAIIPVALKFLGWVGLIAGVGYLLWKNWDKVTPVLDKVVDQFRKGVDFLRPFVEGLIEVAQSQWDKVVDRAREAWEKLWPTLQEIGNRFRPLWESIVTWWSDTAWPTIVQTVRVAFDMVAAIITTGATIISAIIDALVATIIWIWDNFGGTITALVTGLWSIIKSLFINGLNILQGLMKVVIGILTLDWETLKEGLIQIWDALWNKITTILSVVWDIIKNFFSELGSVLKPIWEAIWNPIKDFFVNIWNNISEFFQNIWNSDIMVFFRNIGGIFWELWRIILTTVFLVIQERFNRIIDWIKLIWGAAVGYFEFVWGLIVGIAKWVWAEVQYWIISPIQGVWDWLVNAWNTITGWLSEKWGGFSEETKSIWETLAGFIISPITNAIEGFLELKDRIGSHLSGIWETAQSWVTNIRDVLSKIDPREWFSPPITSQVADGLTTLNGIMGSGLAGVQGTVASGVAGARAEFMSLVDMMNNFSFENPLTQFGFSHGTTVDQILAAKALQEAQGNQPTTVNGRSIDPTGGQPRVPTVSIGEINTNADPKEVADEIAWQIITRTS